MNDKIAGRPSRCNVRELRIKPKKDDAEILFVGDVHLGSPQCDKPRFLRQLDYCLKNGIYVQLMGDLVEMSTRFSIGAGIYEQETIGQSQVEEMAEYLKPLAREELILGLHSGNHENRVYDATGINITKALANELGVSFLGDACWNVFKVNGERYTCYSLHGRTGARFDGTALLALERISTSFEADIVCMGHCHKLGNTSVITQRTVNGRVKEFKKHLILTGSYVKYDSGYAQVAGMPISKLGSPKAKLMSKTHDISVSV